MNTLLPDPVETGARAREIYERDLKAKLEPELKGRYVLIDVDSGDYEIGEKTDMNLSRRLRDRHPGARLHLLRIGYPTAGKIGFRPRQ
jgi:hypothetical protein